MYNKPKLFRQHHFNELATKLNESMHHNYDSTTIQTSNANILPRIPSTTTLSQKFINFKNSLHPDHHQISTTINKDTRKLSAKRRGFALQRVISRSHEVENLVNYIVVVVVVSFFSLCCF